MNREFCWCVNLFNAVFCNLVEQRLVTVGEAPRKTVSVR
jgi:hypothetical protein